MRRVLSIVLLALASTARASQPPLDRPPVPPDRVLISAVLVGTWTSERPDRPSVTLELAADGAVTRTVRAGDRVRVQHGRYRFEPGTLSLRLADGTRLSYSVGPVERRVVALDEHGYTLRLRLALTEVGRPFELYHSDEMCAGHVDDPHGARCLANARGE